MRDDYGGENEDAGDEEKDEGGDDEEEDGEAALEDVFARANENLEMDVMENLRRQADGVEKDE